MTEKGTPSETFHIERLPSGLEMLYRSNGSVRPATKEELFFDSENSRLRAELAEAINSVSPVGPGQGHNKPCYYCSEPCSSIAGNPSRWPIPLCHSDEPGVTKWHHIGCVSQRLRALASAQSELENVKEHAAYEQKRADGAVAELVEVHAELEQAQSEAALYSSELKCADEKLAKFERELEKKTAALRLCDRYCEHLHHAKEHQHKAGEPCPVEDIVNAALQPEDKHES